MSDSKVNGSLTRRDVVAGTLGLGALTTAILARRAILFDDITPMGEFQAFLESAASSRQAVPGYGPAGAP